MFENIKMGKVTSWLIGINVFVFIIMTILNFMYISPNPNVNMYQYIMILFSIYDGAPIYNIITSSFIHGSVIHLSMNMFGLYILGNITEYRIRSKDFFYLYALSLILAGLVSFGYIYTFAKPASFVIGASGAIFGVWSFFSLYFHKEREFITIFIVYHILSFAIGMQLAWYSHIGGTIAGVLFWFLYYNKKRKIGGFVL